MALFKINQLGVSATPSHRRLAVGIDLGTTNSLVATVRNEKAETIPDKQGRHLLPSVVYYCAKTPLVGWQARKYAAQYPANTIISIKRLMGRSLIDVQKRYPNLPYKFKVSENGLPIIETPTGLVNPVGVSADILKVLSARAEVELNGSLDGVVITVPAYFDDAQRQGTKDAARLAGLHVLRLLNEPTAAAIAYGLYSCQEGVIAVYDLGGGTFDISLLHLSRGVFEVLAISGNADTGGDDFDNLLACWLRDQAKVVPDFSDYNLHRQFLDAAITAKIKLSDADSAHVKVAGWHGEVSRFQFEELISSLVKDTLVACRRALKDAGLRAEDVREVVMVGGSTRVPLVREQVKAFFGRAPLIAIDADKVVAIGAALHADMLVGNKLNKNILLLDVTPLSLGLEIMGGLLEKIIPRNTTIPAIRSQDFTTFKDNQNAIMIHVLQGERELIKDCRSLARFTLHGLPQLPAGGARIRVTFQVDADGILSVTATEKSTGIEAKIQVKPSYGLSDSEISAMLDESIEHAHYDVSRRRLLEQRVEAERVLEILQRALDKDAALLSEVESKGIASASKALKEALLNNDPLAITIAIKNLDAQTKNFAAYRMDAATCHMLAGHSVYEV